MITSQFILFGSTTFVAGSALAWWLSARRSGNELASLERDMIEQVAERYRAYLELEKLVKDTVEHFVRCEHDLGAEVDRRNHELEELHAALNQVQGRAHTQTSYVRFHDRIAESVGGSSHEKELEAQLSDWQKRLESVQGERRAEHDRQSQLVNELTGRVRELEPLQVRLEARERETAMLRERCSVLEGEISAARARVEAGSVEPGQALAAMIENEHALAEWHARYADLARGRETAITALQGLRSEGEAWKQRCVEAQAKVVEYSTRSHGLERDLAEARGASQNARDALARQSGELDGAKESIASLRVQLGERDVRLSQNEASFLKLESQLVERSSELETTRVKLDEAEQGVRRILALQGEREKQVEQGLEALQAELRAKAALAANFEAEARRSTVEQQQMVARLAELERGLSDRTQRVCTLEGEISARQVEFERIQTQLATARDERDGHARQSLGFQLAVQERDKAIAEAQARGARFEAEIVTLQRALASQKGEAGMLVDEMNRIRSQVDQTKQAVSQQEQQFETAAQLLAKLRPMVEALETEIGRRPMGV